jgi:hypothetical protein
MVGQLSLTKPFTYFLYFRSQNLLYFGRAASSARYRGFIPGSLFTGPHHNPDVNNALEVEPALWIVHREFDSIEQCQRYEEQYLNLYWSDGEWSSRPKWLLNRSNKSGGGSFPAQREGIYRSIERGTHNWCSEKGREKNRQRAIERNRKTNAKHNRSAKMRAVTLLNNSIRCCCLICGKECSRPGMGRHLQTHLS